MNQLSTKVNNQSFYTNYMDYTIITFYLRMNFRTKPSNSMRSMISTTVSSTYILALRLAKELENLLIKLLSKYYYNSSELTESLQNISLQECEIMICFDFCFLFPSASISKTLECLRDFLVGTILKLLDSISYNRYNNNSFKEITINFIYNGWPRTYGFHCIMLSINPVILSLLVFLIR